jgi:thiamine biosynthesis protein ThiI
MKFLIKFSTDITLKSKFVRKSLIRRLLQNLHSAFKHKLNKDEFIILNKYDSLEIHLKNYNKEKILIDILKSTSGICFFWKREVFLLKSFDDLLNDLLPYLNFLENKTFRVTVKRVGVHNFKSPQLERFLGGGILQNINNTKAKMKNYDFEVLVEVKNDKVSLLTEKYLGIGGFPMGAEKKVVSLISGGFDSSVSSFLMMRKGCPTDFLFFNLGGFDHKESVKEICKYLSKTFSNGYSSKLIIINFEEVMKVLVEKTEERYRTILLKRLMLKVAEKLCKDYKYSAIVTGESLAQVSSQTLVNLNVIEKSLVNTPLFRPLLALDKTEIIKYAREIKTDIFSEKIPEFCGIFSKKPSTMAKISSIEKEEVNIDNNIIDSVLDTKEILEISNADLIQEKSINYVSNLQDTDIIIDLRLPSMRFENKLLFSNETLEIPFYDINNTFPTLSQEKNYVFFCSKGIMSKSHAQDLFQKGFRNISIYKKN